MKCPESGFTLIELMIVLAIIGIVLSAIYFIANIYMYAVLGEEGIKDFQQNLIEKLKQQQEVE